MQKPADVTDRFWSKVEFTDACWLWTRPTNDVRGYARFHVRREDGQRQRVYAHRFAYELLVGPIPDGLTLDHLCRVRHCVNPDHLEPVTIGENVRRQPSTMVTHCPQGHPYSGWNLIIHSKNGRRMCRACKYEQNLRGRARRKAVCGDVVGLPATKTCSP